MNEPRYRVAQWATGATGISALRAVLAHPRFDLVAVKVYSPQKAGQDAGTLCGVDPVGILATTAIEDVIAARPDCVIYMPDMPEIDVMCRLLSSGINIATSCLGFNHRDTIDADARNRLEAACNAGGSTLFGTGSTPGWGTETMPLTLSLLQRRFDRLTITDYADMSGMEFSARMMFDHIHFGADPDTLDPNEPIGTAVSTPPSLGVLSQALNLQIDEIRTSRAFARARTKVELSMGTVEAGTVGAVRMEIEALRKGVVVIRRRTLWFITKDIDADWDLRDTGLRYQLDGDVPLDVMVTFPVSAADYIAIAPPTTANPVVNAIPYVCEAEPGIRHVYELPMLLPILEPSPS